MHVYSFQCFISAKNNVYTATSERIFENPVALSGGGGGGERADTEMPQNCFSTQFKLGLNQHSAPSLVLVFFLMTAAPHKIYLLYL